MIYKVKSIVKQTTEFIKTCPFLEDFNIDMTSINTQRFSNNKPPGTAIDYVGSVKGEDKYYTLGDRQVTRQVNFQIWLIRQSNENLYRTEIAEFLFNFEQWIDHCQFYRLTPKIGDSPDNEVMWADNGMFFSDWEGQEISQYMIQLHILYQTNYEEEDY